MRNFREYDIWKDSMIITKDVYFYTKGFPKQDAIINQMQRAAISIPSNIAEGSSRKSSVEFARYIEIALGSAYELETQIELSFLLHYINNDIYKKLISNVCSVEKRMSKFISTLREK